MYRKFLVFVLATLLLPNKYDATNQTKGLLDFLFLNDQCDCACGVPNREAKLLGGEYLRTNEFPWMAQIQVRGDFVIPGTLINDRYVITSASTIIGLTPYDLKVTLGQFDRCFPDVSSQNVSVDAIKLHPDFSPGNRAHDLALVKLSSPINFDRKINPICIALPGAKYVGQVGTVVGWAEGSSADSSCRPRKLGLPILDYDRCVGTALDSQYTSLDKGCLGVIGAKSVICETDAGGPVMYRSYNRVYELIGILSDKNGCADLPSTALYTRIGDHLRWIKEATKDACYCIKS
ncbi:PREDICTED: serine protease 27-like [Nicrophorus vespilloides]|uniref:Serine protease 27-like n=1 Tax=Nicrophorus vespilloides TaxID=110193 RepID=A0ABM1M7N1_NICVS|nr:PREDICTED: serine protease 27-like [Nicrophorus vespilloides]